VGSEMNNKGQALVEFILILPVFLMILFVIVDFGMIFSSKAKLENDSYDVTELIMNGTSIEEIRNLYKDITINISIQGNYQVVLVEKKVNLITPGIYKILDDPYQIEVERVIPYET
jgi:uncharacterized protein (UPF0333 family)